MKYSKNPELKKIQQLIMKGKVSVSVVSVSRSGMSRKMKFYGPKLENITNEIAQLTGRSIHDGSLKVGGCGMDMCFHTLYCALGYKLARERNQHYRTI